ncbi:ubiquitin-like-conjugating enzyme ATG10 [Toxorhynchites rutilus septentrionalis]|uniref:ubiquitin-like-conjugating enzyme ATG10 n=1 Tax=Toxorhynchites rutilus septentrionalis TaxID=329112 RepID=UPI002479C263|nr:ubiquitin-like-conjugating enzyme ATG10 [Toxorhynchites rutilus septentrionalis]
MGRTLTEEQFIAAARQFVRFSDEIQDDWELIETTAGGVYLRKQTIVSTLADVTSAENVIDLDELIVNDPSGVVPHPDNKKLYRIEYHVLYSVSFQVPMLHFNAHKSDGSLLRLEEVWDAFGNIAGDDRAQLLQSLTQMEHPILFKPFFALHPCRTADILANVGEASNDIVLFLSSYGPFVNLNLDLRYANLK